AAGIRLAVLMGLRLRHRPCPAASAVDCAGCGVLPVKLATFMQVLRHDYRQRLAADNRLDIVATWGKRGCFWPRSCCLSSPHFCEVSAQNMTQLVIFHALQGFFSELLYPWCKRCCCPFVPLLRMG
ncbi:hypothetical protein, partial [Sodalis-like endosymbiont of Proechinophthirus fluctus]|uniref:hypothetical protein n=1 Tax=Sodalis-like endosymbiont of Proechinophthirus fluctus TaxID=1462730 RepID=UPI001FCABD5F